MGLTLRRPEPSALADAERGHIDDIVDTDRYPISDLDSLAGRSLIADTVARLDQDGLVQLPGLLRPSAVRALQREMRATSRYVSCETTTTSPIAGHEALLAYDAPR